MLTLPSLAGMLVFICGVPAVVAALHLKPAWRRPLLGLMVFATCYVRKPFYQEVFFQEYRGLDRGFGVTIPDIICCGFCLYLLLSGQARRRQWLPFNSVVWLLLAVLAVLSLVNSQVPLYTFFGIHKILRGFLFYWVIVNVVRKREDLGVVVFAFAATIFTEAAVVFWEKYVTHQVVSRVDGTFRHPNALAMFLDVEMCVLYAALLSGVMKRRFAVLSAVALLGGFIAVVFTRSRAALLLMPAALGLITVVSVAMAPSRRKLAVVAAATLAAMGVIAISLPRIIRRYETAPTESLSTRQMMNEAALAMAADHDVGVGSNMFSWTLGNTEYFWYVFPAAEAELQREDVRERAVRAGRLGTVHNLYLLLAAELGWGGVVLFSVFSLRTLLLAFRAFRKARASLLRHVIVGVAVGILTLHAQGTLEHFLWSAEGMFIFMIVSGLVVSASRMAEQSAQPLVAVVRTVAPKMR